MHEWLPTAHMQGHITGNTQYPGCAWPDETFEHMMRCPNELMKQKREEFIASLRKKGLKARVPGRVMSTFATLIENSINNRKEDVLTRVSDRTIRKAIHQQMAIGIKYMVRGFIATGWYEAIKATGAKYPERKMNALLRLVWGEVVLPMWQTRNDIMHRRENKNKEMEDRALAEKLMWYLDHRRDVLSHHDAFLARVDASTLHRVRLETKREWIRRLDVARDAYTNELKQRANSQNVITRYLFRRQNKDTGAESLETDVSAM